MGRRAQRLQGRVRLWGGIGFASGSLLTGMLAQLFPRLGLMVVFWENIVLTALTVLVTSWLARLEAAMAASSADLASALHEDACEAGRGSGHEAVPAAGQGGGEAQERVVDKVSKLLLSGPMPAFFLAVFSLGIGEGTMQMYTYVRLKELPYGTETVMGLSAVCMIVSEVPFFYYSAVLVRRFGVLPIVALALVCQCARQLWIALLWDARWVLPGELLHGITFSVANVVSRGFPPTPLEPLAGVRGHGRQILGITTATTPNVEGCNIDKFTARLNNRGGAEHIGR